MTLDQLVESWAYFDSSKRDANHFTPLFNTWQCEICGTELADANGVHVDTASRLLAAHGLKDRAKPMDEGGWSELHGLATCSECCYDADAPKKHGLTLG